MSKRKKRKVYEESFDDDLSLDERPKKKQKLTPKNYPIEDSEADSMADFIVQDDKKPIEPSKPNADFDWYDDIFRKITTKIRRNKTRLRNHVIALLKKKVDGPADAIESVAKSIVDKLEIDVSLPEDLSPGDRFWQLGMSKDKIAQIKPKLRKLRKAVKKDTPTIFKIVEANISFSDKKRALELFDVFVTESPFSSGWDFIRAQINKLIKTSDQDKPETIASLDTEETRLGNVGIDFDQQIKQKILLASCSDTIKRTMLGLFKQMQITDHGDSIRKKLLYMVDLPYICKPIPTADGNLQTTLIQMRSKLDSKLYGMEMVKDIIMNAINDRLTHRSTGKILALKGPPGVGKTEIAAAVAFACDLPFDKISLGGVTDPTLLKGSDEVWSGSNPQIMLHILTRAKFQNPVVLIDELDKVGRTARDGTIHNALIEILDDRQNNATKDLYLKEFDHDLSNVWFILSMNDDTDIHPAIKSRLNTVNVKPYTVEDTYQIIQRFLLPAELKLMHLETGAITVDKSACDELIKLALDQSAAITQTIDIRIIKKNLSEIISCINMYRTIINQSNTNVNRQHRTGSG